MRILEPEGPTERARLDEAVLDTLCAAPLFAGMDRREVREVAGRFDEESFNAGHRITLEGMRGADFFIITSGIAEVSLDRRWVATLRAGDFFGELGVLGNGLRFATVSAETPLRCLVLPNHGLEELILHHPTLSRNLLREVVARLQDLATKRPHRA
ncbi:MAG: cyclic nucleotide-binding domain-containing protein [Candidatus Dormibacteraeota bacterium]|nr:cyclic nucleotide-binding domain-containing protein [Candidatus Dormibacteraeota bacterium]